MATTMLYGPVRDLRYALRSLRREPTFVLGVVCTFALAIGTNAAMLGLVTRLMLAPPPGIRDAERVTRLHVQHADADGSAYTMSTMSYPAYLAFAGVTGAFSSVAAVRFDTLAVGRGAELTQVPVAQASGHYFGVLGATPAVGRFFGPSDDELPMGSSVVVLGHAYWMRQFAGDPRAVGRDIIVGGEPFTIIGVAPHGFNGETLSPVDLFLPLTAAQRSRGVGWWSEDGLNLVSVVTRMAPGVTPAVAAEMATAALRAHRGADPRGGRASVGLDPVVPGASSRQSPQARIALWLAGVSAIVLLIATANVGTLLLLRAEKRRRDLAVRIALGAGYGQVARQLLVESVVLAVIGAGAGLLLSRWLGAAMRATLLPNVAPSETFVDQRVLVASILVAGVAGLLAGASPLVRLGRRNVSLDLRAGGHGSSGRFTSRNVLVGVQVALCTVLLVGAGLFVRSLQRVQSQDLGFSTAALLYVTLDFQGYVPGPEGDAAHEDVVQRLATVAGVRRATVVQAFPFGPFHVPPISIPGMTEPPGADVQLPSLYGATPEYLAMMGVTLRQGRLLTEADGRGGALVVLVNETMARTVWPKQSAIGKCVRAGYGAGFFPGADAGNPAETAPCREVVGVVRDSRVRSLRPDGIEAALMQYYVPFAQLPKPPVENIRQVSGVLVQIAGDEDRVGSAIRRMIQGTSTMPVYARVRSYQDLIDPQLRSWRLGAVLFSVFAGLALGIASVGVFGVVSYLMTQRTREIGVRLALGATRGAMWRLVVGDALRLVAAGVIMGGAAAMAASPLVRGMLFQTSPWEPVSLGSAAVVLLGVTVIAALWPAWRAGRVDPLVALRAD
jgi:predicted permease